MNSAENPARLASLAGQECARLDAEIEALDQQSAALQERMQRPYQEGRTVGAALLVAALREAHWTYAQGKAGDIIVLSASGKTAALEAFCTEDHQHEYLGALPHPYEAHLEFNDGDIYLLFGSPQIAARYAERWGLEIDWSALVNRRFALGEELRALEALLQATRGEA
jgi:hypothetical protein